ncbi:MAG: 2-hydroxyglutaryl-CoA dehydratase [Planctomycetes bacterium]|nr:2-hydroxyglutaryl-CoA dehydratase [Planctomycetota bacterium]
MLITAGIDIGSGRTKALLLGEDGQILGSAAIRTRANFDAVAREALEQALASARLSMDDIAYTAATGLGRYSITFRDVQVTDITCAARGAQFLFPDTLYVLDMGAQSTRAIRLKEGGKVRDFHTNEKCAAGSGSFLERAAKYLEISVDSLGSRSMESSTPRPISSVCAVLAESEIINHVSEGVPVNDVVRGLHESLAERALTQLKKIGLNGSVTFVGGVAVQQGMVEACRRKFGVEVLVPKDPVAVTALGAAVLARQRATRRMAGAGTSSRS